MGKSTINGPFSIAMLNYQRVYTVHQLESTVKQFGNFPISLGMAIVPAEPIP